MFLSMYLIIIICFCNIMFLPLSETKLNTTFNIDVIPRVVNGWPGKLGDVPYLVAFKILIPRSRTYRTYCGGAIVGPNKLLSAAHCFVDNPDFCSRLFNRGGKMYTLSQKYAVAGNLWNHGRYSVDSPENGQWRSLKYVQTPNSYSFPNNDIAIVFTHKPFIFNDYVNYITYASRFADYVGQCLVSGYGRTGKKSNSDRLLLGHLTLLPMQKCNRMMRTNMQKLICTALQPSDIGKGDSGGPLVCIDTRDPKELPGKGVIVGIVSGTKATVGSFFTRVSVFHEYIERNCIGITYNRKIMYLILEIQTLLFLF